MSELNKLLDKIKETRSIASDNALAASIGVSRQRVSAWRHGTNLPDPVACATIAGLSGEPLAKVLGIVGEARAISREEKSVWRKLAASAVALFVMVGATTLAAPTANASQRAGIGPISQKTAVNAYYVSGRAFLTLLGDVLRWLRWRFSRRTPGPDNIEAFAA